MVCAFAETQIDFYFLVVLLYAERGGSGHTQTPYVPTGIYLAAAPNGKSSRYSIFLLFFMSNNLFEFDANVFAVCI